jgi:hypothetical protein
MRGAFRHTISQCKSNVQRKFTNKQTNKQTNKPRAQRFPIGSSPKEISRWEKFDDDDEAKEEVLTFKGQAANFYDSGTEKLGPRPNKCLDNAGDYVEK